MHLWKVRTDIYCTKDQFARTWFALLKRIGKLGRESQRYYFAQLMPEMPHPRKHHRQSMFICSGNNLFIPHRATWLNNCRDAVFRGAVDAVAEGEERIGCHHRAFYCESFIRCLDSGNFGAVNTAHLPCTNADRHAVLTKNNRVRFYKLCDLPGEQQVLNLGIVRRLVRHYLEIGCRNDSLIFALHQQAARNFLEIEACVVCVRLASRLQYANIFLFGKYLECILFYIWRDDNLDKLFVDDCPCGATLQCLIECDDAAKCRGRVGRESFLIGIVNIVADRNATWIRMFDDDAGRLCELPDALQSRVAISNVVIRQRLALELACAAPGRGKTRPPDVGFHRSVVFRCGRRRRENAHPAAPCLRTRTNNR